MGMNEPEVWERKSQHFPIQFKGLLCVYEYLLDILIDRIVLQIVWRLACVQFKKSSDFSLYSSSPRQIALI